MKPCVVVQPEEWCRWREGGDKDAKEATCIFFGSGSGGCF